MMPGGNILGMANRVISRQSFTFFPFLSRAPNVIGMQVATYAAGIEVKGNVQPVPRNLYYQMGLDMQKSYFNFFLPTEIIDVTRDVSGDQFKFQGRYYQLLSKTPWHGLDGWDQVLCVEVTGEGACGC